MPPYPNNSRDFSIYVHIPFCKEACPYCNFNFRLIRNYNSEFLKTYIDSLILEYRAKKNDFKSSEQLVSCYIGGGTPSLVEPNLLEPFLEAIAKDFDINRTEFTLEANPEDIAAFPDRVSRWRQMGFNRISLGVQSMNAETLSRLGRHHRPKEIGKIISDIRRSGFENLSLDLMGHNPGQSMEMFQQDVTDMVDFQPDHISFYGLTIEEKTPFYTQHQKGQLELPDEELETEIFLHAMKSLPQLGYQHYEISNFAKPGFESKHNQGYWTYRNYLGLGAGAHSFRVVDEHRPHFSERWSNIRDPQKYVQAIALNKSAGDQLEALDKQTSMAEFVFTGLRRIQGFSPEAFISYFDCEFDQIFASTIQYLQNEDLLRVGERISLTSKGILFSNEVFQAFIAETNL